MSLITLKETMRKILLTLIVLLPFVSFAQIRGTESIDWIEKKEMFYGDFKVIIPQFIGNSFHYDSSKNALLFTLKIKEPISFDNGKVIISNIIYESISVAQLGDLSVENITDNTNAIVTITNSRNTKEAFITLNPIIKDNFSYKRIKSFSYEVENTSSRTARLSANAKSAVDNFEIFIILNLS